MILVVTLHNKSTTAPFVLNFSCYSPHLLIISKQKIFLFLLKLINTSIIKRGNHDYFFPANLFC